MLQQFSSGSADLALHMHDRKRIGRLCGGGGALNYMDSLLLNALAGSHASPSRPVNASSQSLSLPRCCKSTLRGRLQNEGMPIRAKSEFAQHNGTKCSVKQ